MKNQLTFTDLEYSSRKRTTRREEFLDTMDSIIPWEEFVELIRPHYYKNRTGPSVQRYRNHAADVPSGELVQPLG